MKNFLNKWLEFYNSNKKAIIILSLFFGIFWTFFMALTEVVQSILFFVINFFLILPFGLIGGILFALIFIKCMQASCGEYIITYMEARVYRLFLRKYDKSIEPYKTTLTMLKSLRPKGIEKASKKYYLHSTYNDLAICYSKLEDKKLAEKYIKKAVKYLPNKKKPKYINNMCKKYIDEKQPLSTKKKICIVALICIINLVTCIMVENKICEHSPVVIVSTDNIESLNNFQNVLLLHFPKIIIENDGKANHISITNPQKYDVEHAILIVADSKYFDETISFPCINNTKNVSNKKNYIKRLKRRLERVILSVDGVTNAEVKIILPKDMFDTKTKPSFVVTIKDFKESSDVENAKKLITNVLLGGVPGITKENVTLDIEVIKSRDEDLARMYYWKADYDFFEKEYNKAVDNMKLASMYNSEYKQQYNDLKRFVELNKLISKYPNNYKLYIERGDLQNIPRYAIFFSINQGMTSNFEGAIEDYNKALELNPKAYEVYEKRGDAWTEVYHFTNKTGTKSFRDSEDDQHAIDDYKKAIELTGGNDRLFEKLGDKFQYSDPATALEYYNKIKNPFNEYKNKIIPPIKTKQFDFFYEHSTHDYVPLKMVNCYAKLKQYDKALTLLDKIIEHKEYYWQVNNLKFLYNWKAGHYMTAIKNADNCSVWVCQLAGIFF